MTDIPPNPPFEGAEWMSRPVPASTRIRRAIRRDRLDVVEPGHELAQSFRALGPVVAVNLDVAGPQGVDDPFTTPVDYTIALRRADDGTVVAQQHVTWASILWEYFGQLLEVSPPAPPGDYEVVLRPASHAFGWWAQDSEDAGEDDGVSPLPVGGVATRDGVAEPGVRLIGVETLPAPNPEFRSTVRIAGPVERATLSAVVLGTGQVRINGVRVGEEALEPAVSDYDRSVYYRTWDVAPLLAEGDNALLIEAGRERWAARGGDIWGWHLAPWHREPAALLRLDATLADGTSVVATSGPGWLTRPGPVETERLFLGEEWLLRAEEPAWEPAAVAAPPAGRLRPSLHPAVHALPPIPAIVEQPLGGGSVVHDFGSVMVGRIRLVVTGAAGARIRVTTGEARDADGRVVCDNVLVAGDGQRDVLTLETAADGYRWEPRHGYRGFRWAQVDVEGDATVAEVRAVPLYTPVEPVGALTSAEPLLQWIDAALATTFRNNLHGIPTDTPIYEKNGWTADAHLATEALLHHFDLRAAFGKWLDDHVDAQREDGAIPWIVPTPGWGRDSDPVWSISAVLIPWYLYREHGDRALLERYAPMIVALADDLLAVGGTGVWPARTWGDWLAPGGHGVGPEGMAPLGTLLVASALQHTALVLAALGDDRAARYGEAARALGRTYHATWFDPATGHHEVPGVGYRQVLDVLPLAFGLVPDQHVASVRAALVRDLEERTGRHLDLGAIGVRHLLQVLSEAGRDDLALDVLLQRTRPGWGAWYEAGERTLVESWDVDARSRNHYFLGSVASWIQQRVGAMRVLEPGWRRFEVRPVDDPRVPGGSIRHRTPLGDAAVSWTRGVGGWAFDVEVPEGATAVVVAGEARHELAAGTHHLRIPPARGRRPGPGVRAATTVRG